MSLDKLKHLVLGHAVGMSVGVKVVDEVIRSVTHFALLAVKQRVGEAGNMAACLPYSGVHEDIRVDLIAVFSLLDKSLSPRVFDVILQPCAEGAIVPSVGKAAVDLAAGENEASALTKSDDFIHGFFLIFHHIQNSRHYNDIVLYHTLNIRQSQYFTARIR